MFSETETKAILSLLSVTLQPLESQDDSENESCLIKLETFISSASVNRNEKDLCAFYIVR